MDQRQAMYNGWARNKIFLDVTKQEDNKSITVSTIDNNKTYTEKIYKEDLYGSANGYNITFRKLLSTMQSINKNIELNYIINNENH